MTPDETRPDRDALHKAFRYHLEGTDPTLPSTPLMLADVAWAVLEPALTQRDAEIGQLRIQVARWNRLELEANRRAAKAFAERDDARRRLAAVEILHGPGPTGNDGIYCTGCPEVWPCPPRAALAGDQP